MSADRYTDAELDEFFEKYLKPAFEAAVSEGNARLMDWYKNTYNVVERDA